MPRHRSALQINSTATMPYVFWMCAAAPLPFGMVCGTMLQIAQRNAGVGIVARISCDVALMLGGWAMSGFFLNKGGFARDNPNAFMFGILLMVTGALIGCRAPATRCNSTFIPCVSANLRSRKRTGGNQNKAHSKSRWVN